ELRKCLGGSDVDTALRRCLCADHLSPHATPWHVSDAVFQSLSDWWQSTIAMNNPETNMPTELYEQLVARFCGSATTVDVVTATSLRKRINCTGEAVAEAGKRMTQLMLLCEYDKFQTFCDDLVTKVPQVCIWAASCLHKLRPDCLPEKQLTNSLRCPPAVTRQITDSSLIKEEYVYGYTVDPELPPPTDGPKVHWPRHDRGVAHEGKPEDCHQCGVGIANILDKDLNLNPN
ncbi:hypothetical protein BaRGS_00031707, partial [Batillaria attramentaria]